MEFFFCDNNGKIKLDINVGSKWSEHKTESDYLNTIFLQVDDGDGVVQQRELDLLSKLLKAAKNVLPKPGHNFEVIKTIDNPIEFLAEYKKQSDGKTIYSWLLSSFKKGQISKEEFFNYLEILQSKFEEFEENYVDKYEKDRNVSKQNRFFSYGNNYGRIISKLKDCFKRQEIFENNIANGEFTREQINDLKQYIKKEFNHDLTEFAVAEFLMSHGKEKCGIYDEDYNYKGIDIEKLKELCKTDKFYGESFTEYLDNVLCYAANGHNDTLESIDEHAKIVEAEYERYNFDLNKSAIGDLLKISNAKIESAEQQVCVTKTPEKISLRNEQTGEKRIIDINKLTANLDESSKETVVSALNGMNNATLWEFALEVKVIKMDASGESGGEYFIDDDHVGINSNTTKYSLIHEMCHAMMATIIDGKNTFNEPLFEEFAQVYNEEQEAHKSKLLVEYGASDYNYCASNILEFAAEAGCLYLTGESVSEFTIAKHFPKSYRLFVSLIERIQGQVENRSM